MASNERQEKPDLLKQLEGFRDDEYEYSRQQHTTVTRVSSRSKDINWDIIKRDYILGKRKQLEDGTWITEDYTYSELRDKYQLKSLGTLKNKAAKDSWTGLRKAYLSRVNQNNIGQELGLYTTENFQAEITSINICNKLGLLANKYIEDKYGEVLDKLNDTDSDDSIDKVTVIDLKDLQDSVKVITEVYNLQKRIYDSAPKTDQTVIDEMSKKRKYRTSQQREQKINELKTKLQVLMS